MSLLLGLRIYYSLFGFKGALLAARAKVFKKNVVVSVSLPDLQHPVHLRLRSSDVTLFRSIILDRDYEWPLAKPPRTIVDAGANIGLTSIFYANLYPEAQIIAVEPESSNYEMLLTNTAKYRNIQTVQAALWSKNETVNVIDRGIGFWAFQTARPTAEFAGAKCRGTVQGLTVDRLMSDFHIDELDLLKVDVEGSETEVFENSAVWIDRVAVLVIELHDSIKAGCSSVVNSAAKNLAVKFQRGETTFYLREDRVGVGDQQADSLKRRRNSGRMTPPAKIIGVETVKGGTAAED